MPPEVPALRRAAPIKTIAARARFEAHVSRISQMVRPLLDRVMACGSWPDWFSFQMERHGPTIVANEADNLARQALHYRDQLSWLLPDVDDHAATRHAAQHIARARGFGKDEELVSMLQEAIGGMRA